MKKVKENYVWVKNQHRMLNHLEPSLLYLSKSRFKLGDNAYLDNNDGYVRRRPTETCLGRVIFIGKNLSFKANVLNCDKVYNRLVEADGKPENFGTNWYRDRII